MALSRYWDVRRVTEDGLLYADAKCGFMFEAGGLDASFLSTEQLTRLHQDWRSVLRLDPEEELQIVFRKRVEFASWVEKQLAQTFLADNAYGRKILLDRLTDHIAPMSTDEPRLLSQKILVCYWTPGLLGPEDLNEKRKLLLAQMQSFGFKAATLDRRGVEREMNVSAQDLQCSEGQEAEWPSLKIEAGQLMINEDRFRALELKKLPENFSELGMIQSITGLPYPMDVCVRLTNKDARPIVTRLARKRNVLDAQRGGRKAPAANLDNQIEQIDHLLRDLAAKSESIFEMRVTVGLRLPRHLGSFQRKALANMIRASAKMDFSDFEETTLGTFDAYLECIPAFTGRNGRSHTVLGSNAIHFLPFFRPSKGDARAVVSFETRSASLYGIDPVSSRLANYNWLVSGTSGAGKSFFVNSLLAQSASLDPNVFIVDIGGSYNKLTRFLGGRVMSLEPGQGFELSPFFLERNQDPQEERLRRQHIFQIFLEMVRLDDQLPSIKVRNLLFEGLKPLFEMEILPERPVSYLIEHFGKIRTEDAQDLAMLLKPWGGDGFFAQFLDSRKIMRTDDRILTFDLKGLTEFADLARVVQLIVCASLWARVRQTKKNKFSWIVLDEVAFSLLKTQPQFVDELVSTLRKYFAGVVIVVQDLEKITSNFAGSSILQNTQSKAILQQRGDPRNFAAALDLNELDQGAIESLRREKGSYSDIFLIRDEEKTVIRHVPSELEYWLATTAPEDDLDLDRSIRDPGRDYQSKIIDFVASKNEKVGESV